MSARRAPLPLTMGDVRIIEDFWRARPPVPPPRVVKGTPVVYVNRLRSPPPLTPDSIWMGM